MLRNSGGNSNLGTKTKIW